MDIQQIKTALINSFTSFSLDELAYLSLTSKNEFPIRDRLAYEIYKENPQVIASREYKKIDLAIFFNGEDVVLTDIIELKSWYLFDLYNSMGKVTKATDQDFLKNSKFTYVFPDAKQYAVIIATHPTQVIPMKYVNIVKYLPSLNKMARSIELTDVPTLCNRKIEGYYSNLAYRVEKVQYEAGIAFGCKVDIYAWIIEKLKK